MSAYIPQGPQTPFSKDRPYGQEPGFVSRNSGKIFLLLALFAMIATALVLITTNIGGDDPDEQAQQNQQQQ
jgi:hypothetical protein